MARSTRIEADFDRANDLAGEIDRRNSLGFRDITESEDFSESTSFDFDFDAMEQQHCTLAPFHWNLLDD